MLPCWQGWAGFSRRKWKRLRQKKERFNLPVEVSGIGGGMAQWAESFPEKPEDSGSGLQPPGKLQTAPRNPSTKEAGRENLSSKLGT